MLLTPTNSLLQATLTWSRFSNRLFGVIKTQSQAHCIIKMAKPNVVFVLGPPGVGKGTQCQRIVDRFGYVHLSAGDLLRAELQTQGSEHLKVIEHHIFNSTIVPVKITCSLLERAMKESEKNDFLIDGFPRNEDNLTGWTEAMGDKVNLKFVLNFDCEESTCIKRCLARGADAAESKRTDDNVESLKKRFVTFTNATQPIIEHFDDNNMVKTINAERSEDEVWVDVEKLFQ